MNNMVYHKVLPENVKSSYAQNENVDFVLAFENSKILLNNIRIEGEVRVYSTGTTDLVSTDRACVDARTGAHSFIAGITTQFQNSNIGVIENINEYPRLVRMNMDATQSKNDMLNSDNVCELKSPDEKISQMIIKRRVPRSYGSGGLPANSGGNGLIGQMPDAYNTNPNFSIKPHICLNRALGGNTQMSYQQSGAIKLTLTLERNLNALYGVDVDNNYNYVLSNLQVCFMSVPDVGSVAPVRMRTSLNLKNSLTSAQSNMSSKVPAICDSVSISYLLQSRESNPNYSNVALEMPPNFSRIDYMFNDSFNKFITYEIKDKVEMIKRGLDSIPSKNGNNNSRMELLSSNDSFLTGLNWNTLIDLSNQKFNVNQTTNISNNDAYIMFMYFHSIVQV